MSQDGPRGGALSTGDALKLLAAAVALVVVTAVFGGFSS